ncbi:MAG TPA: hypothetical protein VGL35_06400 [Rhizomicrobium sp.]|jgi:hypothetical protein
MAAMIQGFRPTERVNVVRFIFAFISAAVPSAASANLVISSDMTQNMSCSARTCVPTAKDAVLNISDLENMLAAGNLTVATAGSGVDAQNIDVETGLSWSTGNSLSLDASFHIHIDMEIVASGMGGLALRTASPLTDLILGRHGRVVFQNTSSQFSINGTPYTLVNSISSLASAIASNPSGSFALANNYDASADGTYSESPITTTFMGAFEGLGNTISHLSIAHTGGATGVGLILLVFQGTIEHVHLTHVDITGTNDGQGDAIGSLAGGTDDAHFFQDSATGTIRLRGGGGAAGGLVGLADAEIDTCFADVTIDAANAKGSSASGGLVGFGGPIIESFASGDVIAGKNNNAGGLVGIDGFVENSYSTGSVSGGVNSKVGGLIGKNNEKGITGVYSTGVVSGESPSYVGGFAGSNAPVLSDSYWDTDTSGTTQAVGKGDKKGITGLTTQQLQSGLPKGFDPSVWGERPDINNGMPYLIANPPPK